MAYWHRIACADNPFNLAATLRSGQSFRWHQDAHGIWWGVVDRTILALWQAGGSPDSPLFWQTFPTPGQRALVMDYLRLDVDLPRLYREWSETEPRMAGSIQTFRGLRLLRQPPQECFFAFQCATCNTVVKIERSIRKLAERYGDTLTLSVDASVSADISSENIPCMPSGQAVPPELPSASDLPSFYAFPTLEALAGASEQALRSDLWGYRAPRVISLAQGLLRRPPDWLLSLRAVGHDEARTELTALHGIGEKLADCICLFSLDKDESTPVDTHVRQIALRLFLPELSGKSLTPRVYAAIAGAYRDRFGRYAGWAQQYLFFGELHRASDFAADCGS